MNSSSPRQEPRRRSAHPQLRQAQNALLWVGLIVLAVIPIPWW